MPNVSARLTIDAVVNKALLTIPESQRSIDQKRRYIEFAIDALRDLRLLVTRDGKVIKKVTPDINNRVPYPLDCEEPIGIAIPHNGLLWYLTRNNDLITTTTISGIDEILDDTQGEGVSQPIEQSDSIFAKGGVNFAGYYTFDDVNRQVIINSSEKTELLLVYLSNGINISAMTYIPYKYVPAVIAYILWMDIVADKTIPESTKFGYEKRYIDRCNGIKKIEAPAFHELADAWTSGNSLIK